MKDFPEKDILFILFLPVTSLLGLASDAAQTSVFKVSMESICGTVRR